jgi:hypothetical protein
MGSRSRRPAPPPRTGINPWLLAVVLIVLGATTALAVERFVPVNGSPAATPVDTSGDAALPSDAGNLPSDEPSAEPSDAPSDSPAAPILEAALPTSVNGTPLAAQSALGSAILGADPSSRALGASVGTLGHKSDDLEVAYAYDESGSLDLTVLGFRIAGVDPKKLEPIILDAWLSSNAAGVKVADATVGGVPVKQVTYGDDGPTETIFIRGDSVFVVETSDASLAAATIAAMPKPGTSAAPASPAASPGASLPAASASAVPLPPTAATAVPLPSPSGT